MVWKRDAGLARGCLGIVALCTPLTRGLGVLCAAQIDRAIAVEQPGKPTFYDGQRKQEEGADAEPGKPTAKARAPL